MNLTLDLQDLNKIVFQRLHADAEGTALRAALGAGAASVIPAEALKLSLPATPFVALRRGPVPLVSNALFAPIYTWYLYDDPQQNYWRIDGLLYLIGKAYAARLLDSPRGGAINEIDGSAGPQTSDDKLGGLLVATYQLIVYA